MSEAKIIIIAVAVVVVLFGGGIVYHRINQAGYDRCQTEQKTAVAAAKDKARNNVVKVEKAYASRIKELQNAPDSGSAVGPLTARAIDGL